MSMEEYMSAVLARHDAFRAEVENSPNRDIFAGETDYRDLRVSHIHDEVADDSEKACVRVLMPNGTVRWEPLPNDGGCEYVEGIGLVIHLDLRP